MDAEKKSSRTIVVGVDGSADSHRAAEWAAEEARRDGARILLVHAWHIPSLAFTATPYGGANVADAAPFEDAAAATLQSVLDGVDMTGIDVESTVVRGPAAAVLVEASRGADVIVIGSRGLGGFSGMLLGSVGQQLANEATVPVVIVPKGTQRQDMTTKGAQ